MKTKSKKREVSVMFELLKMKSVTNLGKHDQIRDIKSKMKLSYGGKIMMESNMNNIELKGEKLQGKSATTDG